jgi:tryptophan-rich sensory protein
MIYLAVYFLNILDLVLTHYAVNVWDIATEMNLLMLPYLECWRIVAVKFGVVGLALYLLYRKRHYRFTRRGVMFLFILYALVVLNNGAVVVEYLFF